MKSTGKAMVSDRGLRAIQHLGGLIQRARIAKAITQKDLAERARITRSTLARMEKGEAGVALWTWINVFEVLGLLKHLESLSDPLTDALVHESMPKRVRGPMTPPNPDY